MQYYSSYQAYNKNIQFLYNNGIYHFQSDFGNGSCYNNKIYNKNIYYAGQQVPVLKKPPYFSLPGGGDFEDEEEDEDDDEDDDYDDEEDEDADENSYGVINDIDIDYNNEEEVLNLQRDIQSTSKSLKEVAESQKQGIGISDDFEPRDDDDISVLSQDSNMSFLTHGDAFTEKDITEIMNVKHLDEMKIQDYYKKLKTVYPELNEYENMNVIRLRMIFTIQEMVLKINSIRNINNNSTEGKRIFTDAINNYRKNHANGIFKMDTLHKKLDALGKLHDSIIKQNLTEASRDSPSSEGDGFFEEMVRFYMTHSPFLKTSNGLELEDEEDNKNRRENIEIEDILDTIEEEENDLLSITPKRLLRMFNFE